MEQPGIATEGIQLDPTTNRQVNSEQIYYNLELANQPLTPEQQRVFDRAGEEVQRPYETEQQVGLIGRRTVKFHVLNNNDETERDCLFMAGSGQSLSDPFTEQSVRRLAAIHPETRWIIPTTPGLSGTDRLPQSILRGLRKGSFIEVGEYMLEAIRPARNHNNPLDIYAYSQGSSIGVGMGAASEKGEVRDIRAVEPAALQRRSFIGMLIAAQMSETHAKRLRELVDSGSVVIRETSETGAKRRLSLNEVGGLLDMYLRYPAAMGRAALWPDATRALDKISGHITTLIGERSEFNKMPRVQAALARSALKGSNLFRIGTFNGFHSSIVTNMNSLAALA